MAIPATLQDVIMARVDALPEGAKEVLQAGSAIEREFSHKLIKGVTGLSEDELLARLSILKDAELLFDRGIYPESTYIFKHNLTRDVVYESILRVRKKKLHETIGNMIEVLYQDNIYEQYEILAEHFIYSENYVKGAAYSKSAGRKAEKSGSLNDALSYAKKRVSCLEKLPINDDVEKKIISARTVLGLYYTQFGLPVEAKAVIDPIVDLAIKCNYKRRVSQIYIVLGYYYYIVNEDHPKAIEYSEEALKIGEELNDLVTISLANMVMGHCLSSLGDFEKALPYFEKVLEINMLANVPWGISAVKSHIVIWVYLHQGKIEAANQTSHEALEIANVSGDIYSKSHAYWAYGTSSYYKGSFKISEEYLLKAVDFSETINQLAVAMASNFILGETYRAMGNYKNSQQHYERSISHCRHGYPSWDIANKIAIELSQVINKDKNKKLNRIFKWHEDIKIKWIEGLASNYIGAMLLNIDEAYISEAEDWINEAIETNQKYGMRWNLAQDYALYAELYKRKGDRSKAKENLSKAIDIFTECGADGWVDKYEKELASVS
jgi:tetratricopeptide (TPR) repeat protein